MPTHILIAEDERFLANALRVKLTKAGYTVTVTSNGEEALSFLATTRPDLVLLDIMMPIKDGFEVLTAIKANPQLTDLKVIMLSNLGQDEDIARAKQLGALGYLVKSNTPIQTILDQISQYLPS